MKIRVALVEVVPGRRGFAIDHGVEENIARLIDDGIWEAPML